MPRPNGPAPLPRPGKYLPRPRGMLETTLPRPVMVMAGVEGIRVGLESVVDDLLLVFTYRERA